MIVEKVFRWLDERLRVSSFARTTLNRIFPDHWSFLLGELALYCFVILVLTGVYLTFFFVPSSREVVYGGSYAPLHGVRISEAYESVLSLSFDVRAGLVMRQIHHWAALIFLAAILVHMMRVFFTGAFRRPRELNWVLGVTLLLLSMFNGFTGYSLPDDLLSGTGLRIAYSVALSIPVVGTWFAFLVFGGEFPTTTIISRLYVIHIMAVPGAIGAVLAAHLAILWRQKHTQFAGPGRSDERIVGSRLWPAYAAKSAGLFFVVLAVLAALGGLVQINPVWIYGPFRAHEVTAGSQPDWYLGWLEGALRLMPPWEIRAFGYTLPNPFFPGVLLPGLVFNGMYLWPWIEARFTKDRRHHNLLDRPRDAPLRTAVGTAALTFYAVLFAAGGNDVLAVLFSVSIEAVTRTFQVLVLALPPAVGYVTFRVCKDLARTGRPAEEPAGHVLRRTPGGGYEEIEPPEPARAGPD